MLHLNAKLPEIWHGGDYNPEQWPAEVWDQDMELMQETRFRVAAIGIFSWVALEPREGDYRFEWLDEVIAKLEAADRYFILATPSAAPPAWLSKKYPETLRVDSDGHRRGHGNRVNYSLGSRVYREKTREIARRLAERYGNHPRLLAWHLSNEYGGADYGAESVEQFRAWLQAKYGQIENLNHAYWTAFWGHTFGAWSEIDPPGPPYGETAIQGLSVDWQRFVTDQTIDFMNNEAAPLREISPEVPITTNLMGLYNGLDYRKFSAHLDFVSWDSYPLFSGTNDDIRTWVTAAFTHDLMRSVGGGKPWLLMEFTPSSSNWYRSMGLKHPGQHHFEAMQAIAHGADGVQYFQWRQCRGGQEQLHGAVVSHGSRRDARVFQDVKQVGEALPALTSVVGSRVESEVAVLFDWENRWAIDAACGPVQRSKRYAETVIDFYQPLWQAGISADIVGMDDDLSRYRLVIAPMAYSVRPGFAERLAAVAERGGTVVLTYLSGWTDENSLVPLEGLLSPFAKLLGLRGEELDALAENQARRVTVGAPGFASEYEAVDFCELVHLDGARALATYADGFYAGYPALTVNTYGAGRAYYVAARIGGGFTAELVGALTAELGLKGVVSEALPTGVCVRRRGDRRFVLNATPEPQSVTIEGELRELGAFGVWISS